jgi:hypothetical protein
MDRFWSGKPITWRTLFWLWAALFLVLQADFWIAPWHSPLQHAALLGSGVVVAGYCAGVIICHRARIWRTISRMRRD